MTPLLYFPPVLQFGPTWVETGVIVGAAAAPPPPLTTKRQPWPRFLDERRATKRWAAMRGSFCKRVWREQRGQRKQPDGLKQHRPLTWGPTQNTARVGWGGRRGWYGSVERPISTVCPTKHSWPHRELLLRWPVSAENTTSHHSSPPPPNPLPPYLPPQHQPAHKHHLYCVGSLQLASRTRLERHGRHKCRWKAAVGK